MKDTLQYAFVARYAAVAHVCPNIAFKPGAGYLSNVVESTVGQIIDDGESTIIPIPGALEPKDISTETEEVPSIGERIIAEEEDVIGEQPIADPIPATEGLFVLDDLYGINEGELDEDEKNASIVDETAPAKEQFCHGVCRFLTSKSKNAENVVTMEEAAATIASQVSGIYKSLQTDVNGVVEQLSYKINEEVEHIDSGSGAMFLAEQLGTEDPTMFVLDWNRMSSLGTSSSIIEEARRIGGLKGSSFSFSDARLTTRNWKQTIDQTDIPDNVKSNIIQTVEEQTGEAPADDNTELPQNTGEVATMYDETETDDSLTTPIEKSEAVATESLNLLSADVALQVPGIENRLTDMVRSVRDLLTTSNSKLDRLKKINPTVYRDVKKEDLGTRKVELLDKKFVNDLYRSLDSNYANVSKLLRLIESTPKDASASSAHTIVTLATQLGKTVRLENKPDKGYDIDISPSAFINEHTASVAVKDSNWTLQDIQGTVKANELVTRYKPVADAGASIGNRYLNKFNNKEVAEAVLFALIVCEYHHYFAACLLSAMVKTMLRVAYAYEDAYKKMNTAAKETITPMLDDLYGTNEGEDDEDEKNASVVPEDLNKAVESLGYTIGSEGIVTKIRKFIIDKYNGISAKYKALQSIDVNSLPDKMQTVGIPMPIARNILEFTKHSNIDLESVAREFIEALRSCTLVQDTKRKIASEKNQVLDNFVSKYTTFFKNASTAFAVPEGVFQGNPGKALRRKVVKCEYTKQDVRYIKDNARYLKDIFDDSEQIFYKTQNRMDEIVAIIILFMTGVGSINAVVRLLQITQLPSKEDAQQINKLVSLMRGYIEASYKALVVISESAIAASKRPATESISKEVYPIVATQAGYARFMKQMHYAMNAVDTSKQIAELLRIVDKYPKVLNAYKSIDFGISTTDGNHIKNNVDAVMNILNCVGFHLLVCRKYFNDNSVLILDKKHVNKDVLPTFESQAGCMEDIQRHLLHRYLLLNVDLPNTGIRTTEVLRNKVMVAQEHAHRIDSTKHEIEMSHGGAIVVAYNKVLMNYLRNLPSDKIPTGMTAQNFVKMNAHLVERSSAKLRDASSTMDDCLFKFVLDLWYADKPMYKKMYTKFENKYRKLFDASTGDITAEDRRQADAEVLSDVVMDFMTTYFIDRK